MTISTNFKGRLKNTNLPPSKGLLPLFEAVVNSIHAIEESAAGCAAGEVAIDVLREEEVQMGLNLRTRGKQGPAAAEKITGFRVLDTGVGFTNENMRSFETLDSEHKASKGCRGVGRLLWLKAFDHAEIKSRIEHESGAIMLRKFSFTAEDGVTSPSDELLTDEPGQYTTVTLSGFRDSYRERAPKTLPVIAQALLEHCLWYFVRDEGVPRISISDGSDRIELETLYDEYMHEMTTREGIYIAGSPYELMHVKFSHGAKQNSIAWCAAGRLVVEETLIGKIRGLHSKLKDESGEFTYCCYVTSPFLDEHVRPERTGFDLRVSSSIFTEVDPSMKELTAGIVEAAGRFLAPYLDESRRAVYARVEQFVSTKAPRYRPVLSRLSDEIDLDPSLPDKEIELALHKLLSKLELELVAEGHELMGLLESKSSADYRAQLVEYLSKADDIKKSDLAAYVFHRKVILDIFARAIERKDGKYSKEDLLHELIMPMRRSSGEVFHDNANLWLVDERLAFHNYLASDKPLSSFPIVDTVSTKEPDICALNVFDEPILVSDKKAGPFASLVVIEIKRPMRDDAASGEEKDPIEQVLGYLDRIRRGKTTTASGRPIPNAEAIPGYCYVICDITPTVERRCQLASLTRSHDYMGYFGYNQNYNAYIEVISFDKLLIAARERNKAFFDKLGVPI